MNATEKRENSFWRNQWITNVTSGIPLDRGSTLQTTHFDWHLSDQFSNGHGFSSNCNLLHEPPYTTNLTSMCNIFHLSALRFDCNPRTFGYHPHPFICERFIICNEKGSYVCSCQDGLHYHPELRRCEWKRNSKCTHKAYHMREEFKQVKKYSEIWPEG